MSDPKRDIGRLSQAGNTSEGDQGAENEAHLVISSNATGQTIIHNPDIAWIEATQGLQRNLIRSLQDHKATRADKKALAAQRERMITEVTEQYVVYLREEAKLATKAALQARDSMLRQELAKLKATLFIELAEITGTTVVEIERVAQIYSAQMTSPMIQQAYARFIMSKIFDLLEQSGG